MKRVPEVISITSFVIRFGLVINWDFILFPPCRPPSSFIFLVGICVSATNTTKGWFSLAHKHKHKYLRLVRTQSIRTYARAE